jgi:hypothetical protein
MEAITAAAMSSSAALHQLCALASEAKQYAVRPCHLSAASAWYVLAGITIAATPWPPRVPIQCFSL